MTMSQRVTVYSLIYLGQARTILFHRDTTWEELNGWLKTRSSTTKLATHDYAFVTREQQMVITESDQISVAIELGQSLSIDVINREMVVQVVCCYETSTELLRMLKLSKVASLLNDENLRKRLNINETIWQNASILFEEGDSRTTLSDEELKQTLDDFCQSKEQPIHFRISLSLSVKISHGHEHMDALVTDKTLTIEQLIIFTEKAMDVKRYLASKMTKRVFHADEIVFDLGEREFLLLGEKDVRPVCVKRSEDENEGLFTISATIADIRNAYQLDVEHQHLLCDDFVPSAETTLISFPPDSTIGLTIIEHNLPVSVTVRNEQQPERSVQLKCAHSMLVSRLCSISCQLFGIKNQSGHLALSDGTELDAELLLMDMDEEMTEIEFRLLVPEGLSCSITCDERTVVLRCDGNTLASTLVEEALGKLGIPLEHVDLYSIFGEEIEIDLDTTIAEIRDLLSSTVPVISLILKRNDT